MSKVDIYIHICVYPLLFFSVQIQHYSGHLDVPHLRTNKLRQTNFQRTGCVKQLWKSEDCKSPCRAEGPVNRPWWSAFLQNGGGAEHPQSEGWSFPCLFCGTQVMRVRIDGEVV